MATRPVLGDVVLLPKDANFSPDALQAIVDRFKSNRLQALQLDPDAFGSTYERESQFTYQTWLSRITNPLSKTFVALEHQESSITSEDSASRLCHLLGNNEWLGTVTVLGPKSLSGGESSLSSTPWRLFTRENSSESPDLTSIKNRHAVYLIVGMFVSPSRRREGHGRRLVEAALTAAMEESRGISASRVIVCLMVEPRNVAARRLYESVGFGIRGSEPADNAVTFPTIGMTWEKELMA
ncbi:hypothetical protein VTN96DRAFT_9793 [Rasamsonia emersonii]